MAWFPAPVRQVLDFERLTPEPGPDADAVAHEFVAHVSADEPGVLEVGGIATVWDLLVDGDVVRSGRSMFERHEVPIAAGDHEVRIVVHPLTELLDDPADEAPAALADHAGRGRPAALGAHPGAGPGARLLARSAGGGAVPAGHAGHRTAGPNPA